MVVWHTFRYKSACPGRLLYPLPLISRFMRLIFSNEVTNEELESSVLAFLMLLSLYPVW